MTLNKNITVVNEFKGHYFGFYIKGVSFIGKTAKTATESGLNTADYFTCRIPHTSVNGEYISPVMWNKNSVPPVICLSAETGDELMTENGYSIDTETPAKWTLLPQKTWIIIGEVTLAELKDITFLLKNREVYTVVAAKENRFGSAAVSHWRIDCK